jgi:hypothetical protein
MPGFTADLGVASRGSGTCAVHVAPGGKRDGLHFALALTLDLALDIGFDVRGRFRWGRRLLAMVRLRDPPGQAS